MEVKLLEVLKETESTKGNVRLIYKPVYLWQEPDMICLLHETIPFKEYNDSAYLDVVENIDKLYIVYNDLKNTNASSVVSEQMAEVARKHETLAENHYVSLELSLPSDKHMRKKYLVCLQRLRLLLRRKVDEIYRICNERSRGKGPRTRTLFGSEPKGYNHNNNYDSNGVFNVNSYPLLSNS